MPLTHSMREALQDARSRKAGFRDAIKSAKEEHTRQAGLVPVLPSGALDQASEEFRAAQLTNERVLNLQAQLHAVEQEEAQMLSRIAGVDPAFPTRRLASSPEVQSLLHDLAGSTQEIANFIRLGDIMSAEDACALTGQALAASGNGVTFHSAAPNVTPAATGWPESQRGIFPAPAAPLTLLDFVKSEPQETRTVDYWQRSGVAQAGVQEVGQYGGVKQSAALDYVPQQGSAAVVASYVKALRQDLDDFPGLSADINQALTYGVRAELESYLLNGSGGTWPGLLSITGTLAPDVSTYPVLADKIAFALATLYSTGVVANFVALHPMDHFAVATAKATANGEYLAATYLANGRIWQVPIVQTAGLPLGTALVGDSRVAMSLLVRSGVSVSIGTESDDFVRNRVTVLTEGRWTPTCEVPSALAEVSLV